MTPNSDQLRGYAAKEELFKALSMTYEYLKELKSVGGPDGHWNQMYSNLLYEPSDKLRRYIREYNLHKSRSKEMDTQVYRDLAGKLMEKIAYEAFNCLFGHDLIESFTTAQSQLDLVVTGTLASTSPWLHFNGLIGLDNPTQKMIIEAKNTKAKVDSNIFSRLCFLVQNQFSSQCKLAIFFTQNGAKGFPNRGQNQRSFQAARATQILFHAQTEKYIVVFNDADIQDLGNPGALIVLLRDKISDVENMVGTHLVKFDPSNLTVSINPRLPDHLA